MAKTNSRGNKREKADTIKGTKDVVKNTTDSKKGKNVTKSVVKNTTKSREKSGQKKGLKKSLAKIFAPIKKLGNIISVKRAQHYHPHKSFRRSYREDYHRETTTPGMLEHAVLTFKLIFKHWKTFLPFILLMTGGYIVLVGIMSQEFFSQFQQQIEQNNQNTTNPVGNFGKASLILLSTVTTGGLTTDVSETSTIFMTILFLIMWMVTVFLVRHFLTGSRPKLRDALYNALGPLLSTLVVFLVVMVQAIPLILVIITYSAAVATGFLSTPFYALVYFIFAALMILITVYCFSSSLIALVAVTAPGMYPFKALGIASDLMMGRRVKLIARLVFLVIVVALTYIVIDLPMILIDMWLKSFWTWVENVPFVPFMLILSTCFVFVYVATYIYQYYRWLLDYQEK